MKELISGSYGVMYYVHDMKKIKDFYENAVRLVLRFESEKWIEFDLGDGTAICLHACKDGKKPIEGGTLIVNVKDIHSKVFDLKKAGVEFSREVYEVRPGAFTADFRDPTGNLISLYEDTNIEYY